MSDVWIEWRVWRQFATLAEELHFGRAAQRLHMTQPPLTQAIAGLERVLGVRLFDRTKRSVQLTPTGQALLPAVLDVLARAQALPARARAAADGEEGRLRLAFVSTVGFDLLPGWVRRFRDRFGAVQLDLVEATGDVQLGLLERGEVDAGFILHSPGFLPPGLMRYSVAREPLVVALPESHALASRARLSLGDVLAQQLVVFPRRIVPSLYDAIHRWWPKKPYRCKPSSIWWPPGWAWPGCPPVCRRFNARAWCTASWPWPTGLLCPCVKPV
jgi:DNA-binding transcriptional LysR family regulator